MLTQEQVDVYKISVASLTLWYEHELTHDAGGLGYVDVLAVAGEQGVIQEPGLAKLGVVKVPIRSGKRIVS